MYGRAGLLPLLSSIGSMREVLLIAALDAHLLYKCDVLYAIQEQLQEYVTGLTRLQLGISEQLLMPLVLLQQQGDEVVAVVQTLYRMLQGEVH
jgi:hypothetical protein